MAVSAGVFALITTEREGYYGFALITQSQAELGQQEEQLSGGTSVSPVCLETDWRDAGPTRL